MTSSATSGYQLSALTPQTVVGSVAWASYTGGTLLRVIGDIMYADIPPLLNGTNPDAYNRQSHGLFMVEDSTPLQTQWDPEYAHANFMGVWRNDLNVHARNLLSGTGTLVSKPREALHVDVRVKRRIHENSLLWMATTWGTTGVGMGINTTFWGRGLIALP